MLLEDNTSNILKQLRKEHQKALNAADKQVDAEKAKREEELKNWRKDLKAQHKDALKVEEKDLKEDNDSFKLLQDELLERHYSDHVQRLLDRLPKAFFDLPKGEQEDLLKRWHDQLVKEADTKNYTVHVPKGLTLKGVKAKDDLEEFAVVLEADGGIVYQKSARQLVAKHRLQLAEEALKELK